MKLILSLCTLACFLSCSKSEIQNADALNSLGCNNTTKATVKKEMLNESGSDYFYYLAIDGNIKGSNTVFPDLLPSYLQEEGKHINVRFSTTEQKHTYIVCLAGHTMDPNNPDYQSMPMIQVCNATAIN
jgi:hypothetical protein